MPLLLHRDLFPQGEIGLWNIQEDEIFFLEQLQLSPEEDRFIAGIKGHRRLEWLASRYLLHYMSGRALRSPCLKDEYGKPYLRDSMYQVSISHSREIAAVIAAPQAVGVDIQKIVTKIENIAHKFMRPEELESLHPDSRLLHLHIYWGAKEALYKAHGRRQLDFREHIIVEPFVFDMNKGQCSGSIQKEEEYLSFDIYYELVAEHYILVYAVARIPLIA